MKMISRKNRGSVLYETVLVLPLVLLLVLTTVRFGLAGYAQMQSDGAAWAAARYAALNISNPQVQAQTLYPGTSNETYTLASPSAAPSASPPLDWNQNVQGQFNNNNCGNGGLAQFCRHGGSSTILPMIQQAGVATANNGIGFFGLAAGNLAKLITITGTASEPLFLECGQHWMLALTSNSCVNGGVGATNSYFQTGENTPPYYMGTHYLQVCAPPTASLGSAALVQVPESKSPPTAYGWGLDPTHSTYVGCPANSASYLALGSGAFLDLHNWYRTSQSINDMSVLTTGAPVFRELYGHQRLYAAIAQTLGPYSAYIQSSPMINNFPVNAALTPDNSPVGIVYQWDVQSNAQTAQQGSQNIYADMSVGEEFTPLAGLNTTVTLYQPTSPVSLTTVTP